MHVYIHLTQPRNIVFFCAIFSILLLHFLRFKYCPQNLVHYSLLTFAEVFWSCYHELPLFTMSVIFISFVLSCGKGRVCKYDCAL
jgi:hypothetical protein